MYNMSVISGCLLRVRSMIVHVGTEFHVKLCLVGWGLRLRDLEADAPTVKGLS